MKNQKFIAAIFAFSVGMTLFAQDKIMTPEVYDEWNTIENVHISTEGNWVCYQLKPGEGDTKLIIYNTRTGDQYEYDRADKAVIDREEMFVAFRITTAHDSIQALKIKKTKKEDMPQDSLGIFDLKSRSLEVIPHVKSFEIPEKSGSVLAYEHYDMKIKKDSTLVKDEGSENGARLSLRNFRLDTTILYHYIKSYQWSEKNDRLMIEGTGIDSTNKNYISIIDATNLSEQRISNLEGKLSRFSLNQDGSGLAFLADRDTNKLDIKPMELFYWDNNQDTATLICASDATFIDSSWYISPHYTPLFSEDGESLYFGIAPHTLIEDTTIIEDEKVNVEIWHYQDPLLYTQQKIRLKREKERSYEIRYDLQARTFTQLATEAVPEVRIDKKHEGEYAIAYADKKYQKSISWLGYAAKDIYLVNKSTGEQKLIAEAMYGSPRLSPAEKYACWYSQPDTAWYSYEIESNQLRQLTKGHFYDELNDRPMHPWPSGSMAWTEDDTDFLVYDHYDIWSLDPSGSRQPKRLTMGREKDTRYRHINLDSELTYLSQDTQVMVKLFDNRDKSSGYAFLNLQNGQLEITERGPFNYTTRISKAEKSDDLIFTKSTFKQFPDLILSNLRLENQKTISHANPQQGDYAWGSIELVKWTDGTGQEVHGLLVKPDNFDPSKKYPMIVNFYERSSNRLHNHRAPFPHRSTINYSYYSNRGYLIFNPDVRYQEGYPGRSCEEAVMSGVDYILSLGFVDESRMALQGHSWGGYQIAHLLTKTNRFKCAEAGAPVVNMISAYGGIRWGSGMSRMFQYERTQSRLGYTLWERPDLYLENSPIFNMDKVETPVLILHNDKDGAVPWYQGIEYFVALRRLNKPAWFLNYNDEPHWPVKRHNRLDFNKRLQQFFDHYLLDQPMPEWMKNGIPAIEEGFNYGF